MSIVTRRTHYALYSSYGRIKAYAIGAEAGVEVGVGASTRSARRQLKYNKIYISKESRTRAYLLLSLALNGLYRTYFTYVFQTQNLAS